MQLLLSILTVQSDHRAISPEERDGQSVAGDLLHTIRISRLSRLGNRNSAVARNSILGTTSLTSEPLISVRRYRLR
jgi:hypothetical protein